MHLLGLTLVRTFPQISQAVRFSQPLHFLMDLADGVLRAISLPDCIDRLRITIGEDAWMGQIILGVVAIAGGGMLCKCHLLTFSSSLDNLAFEKSPYPVGKPKVFIFSIASIVYTVSVNTKLKSLLYLAYPNTIDALAPLAIFHGPGKIASFLNIGKIQRTGDSPCW